MSKNKLLKNRRHGIGFLLVCLFTLSLSQHGVAQVVPYVDNISYQYTESHRLAFPSGTAFEDIHAYDMPSLEYKEMSYKMEKSLDENGNHQTLQTMTEAVNFYEDWQRLAERWLFNQEGTTIYMAQGKARNKTYNATDIIDHSRMGLEMYQDTKNHITSYGFLTSLVFPSSISDILDGNNTHGGNNTQGGNNTFGDNDTPYLIALDGSMIMTNTGGEYIIYQKLENENGSIGIIKQIKYQEEPDISVYPVFPDENDPEVITMSISVFDIDLCGQLFLSSTTEVVKEVLFNGLCAKRITENIYSDYEFNCQNTAARSSKYDEVFGDMTLSPNPLRSDILNIALPLSLDNEEMQIEIMSLSGKRIGQMSQIVNGNVLQLNVGDMINSQGLYIISVQSSSYTNTKKIFYTQN